MSVTLTVTVDSDTVGYSEVPIETFSGTLLERKQKHKAHTRRAGQLQENTEEYTYVFFDKTVVFELGVDAQMAP